MSDTGIKIGFVMIAIEVRINWITINFSKVGIFVDGIENTSIEQEKMRREFERDSRLM